MKPISQSHQRALWLLRNEIYQQLDEVEFLAMRSALWTEDEQLTAGRVLGDLVTVLRTFVARHAEDEQGQCRVCEKPWPCGNIDAIHESMRDPGAEFLKLAGVLT
ncbi:hypothetical protein [Amycolatopsis samaneae]|uniref:Uncharacterized protein n=1 Tax=Amycolatopsis samaneae TaxID=664691 RepID=A0ABW5GNG1_9PSEU